MIGALRVVEFAAALGCCIVALLSAHTRDRYGLPGAGYGYALALVALAWATVLVVW